MIGPTDLLLAEYRSQITGILNFTVVTPHLFLNSSCTISLPPVVLCAVTEHLPVL